VYVVVQRKACTLCGSCSVEPVVFDFGVAGEFAGYWLSRSVGYKIPLWLGYKRRSSDHFRSSALREPNAYEKTELIHLDWEK